MINNIKSKIENDNDNNHNNIFSSVSKIHVTNSIEKFSTGSDKLDQILGGGIETDSVTQFYGPPGSGKTQICYTLCSLMPKQYNSIYVDTEGKFRAERIIEIIKERNITTNYNDILKKIFVSKVINHDALEKAITHIPEIIDSNKSVKLIIIDSLMNHLRVEYTGRSQLPERQQKLNILMSKLRKIANEKKVAVVITNHVQTNPDSSLANNTETPVGGNIINYASNHIIEVKKQKIRNCATLIKSSFLPENNSYFTISNKGIEEYPT